jgi:glycosyltransferase involved in cell wall biosynthesis
MSFSRTGFPKVLIVSHNCLSLNSNNGKTVLSLFKQWPENNIAQIYFRDEFPDFESKISYFAIRDFDIIKSLLYGTSSTGEVIQYNKSQKYQSSILTKKKPLIYYTIRDWFWLLLKDYNKLLDSWLSIFQPEIIFFVASNNTFSYDFVLKLSKKKGIPIVIYFTDDYILNIYKYSFLNRIHIWRLKSRVLSAIDKSIIRFSIGSEMSDIYAKEFNKNFISVMNQVTLDDIVIENKIFNKEVRLVYMGNLSLNRWKNLVMISKLVEEFNLLGLKCQLDIYSLEFPSENIMKSLNIPPYVNFLGAVSKKCKIYNILNQADIVIHTESFDEDMISITHLSISTKISEYLALGKCIFTFGPAEIASIKFLKKNRLGIVCTNESTLFEQLSAIIQDKELVKKYGNEAELYYKNNMSIDLSKIFNEVL